MLALLLPGIAAAAPVTEPADTRAILVTPLELVKVDDLHFGTLVPSILPGTVTIDALSGAQTALGGVTAVAIGAPQRARFVGAGTAGRSYSVTLGLPPVLSNGSGATMPVLALTLDGAAVRFIPPERAFDIYVGGALAVNANQAPGNYSGTFTLTVDYN